MSAVTLLHSAHALLSDASKWLIDPPPGAIAVDDANQAVEPWADTATRWTIAGAVAKYGSPFALPTSRETCPRSVVEAHDCCHFAWETILPEVTDPLDGPLSHARTLEILDAAIRIATELYS
jgi:hypothetical protein